ncbi:MAG TPA: cation-transporting P-type ATPase [Planctomycetaceae bacterium]|nr:cation-transporting P-type ATPase [Planctomycetaceae bacterium]
MLNKTNIPATPWSLTVDETLKQLATDAVQGLSSSEAARRKQDLGANEIPEPPADPLLVRYWGQLTGDAVVRLLLIGGIVSLLLGDYLEGGAIILMLNIMAGFGLWQEGKADDAAKSLRQAENPVSLIIRDGQRKEIPVADVVPGDIVYLPTGAIPPADGRVIASVRAEEDCSILTGEPPRPVILEAVPATTVVNDQYNMVFRGCGIVSGNATAVITATGSRSNVGQIAARLAESEKVPTPLDEQLDSLGNSMARIFKWLAGVVIGVGLVRQFLEKGVADQGWKEIVVIFKEAFINAVALIIAAIPEGLPAVLTITLAIATKMLVKRNALIRKPKAVEGAGSMTVLLTDKTGTLTANQMEVTHFYLNGRMIAAQEARATENDELTRRLLRIAGLCNNKSSSTEAALSRWVDQSGFEVAGDVAARTVEHEFDQSLKRMTTVHRSSKVDHFHVLTKGAPEHLLKICSQVHLDGHDVPLTNVHEKSIEDAVNSLASKGLRVLALADRLAPDSHALDRTTAEQELTFVGLVGIMDPPRDDVAAAVVRLANAGVRTVMVTGDNPVTAYHVAKMVGIIKEDMPFDQAVITGEELAQLDNPNLVFLNRLHSVRVFARVTPDHKARILEAVRNEGYIVGMTGDGVNDAIALKQSDVGFAMGNGTDVAREASDVILMDSRFGTIPNAVEEGRNVMHRIRLYLSYILSGNGCEVGAFVIAYTMGWDIPLTALVLLVINFATDSFPALAMAFEAGEQNVMEKPPRKRNAPFINHVMWAHIWVQTLVATVVIMVVYYFALRRFPDYLGDRSLLSKEQLTDCLAFARSAAFMTYIWQKLFRGFTARSMTRSLLEIGVFRNPWSIGAFAISMAISLFFVYVPGVNTAMGLAPLDGKWMGIVCLVGLIPPICEEISKPFIRKLQD